MTAEGVRTDVSATQGAEVGVSIVAPAYNEADNLRSLIPDIVEVCDVLETTAELVIVDDGSDDDTRDVLRQASEWYQSVRAVILRRNFGQSAAIAAGIDAADGEVVVTMDADGQNDPADIPRLLDAIRDGYDCVSGRRVDRADGLAKRVPSRIQTVLAKATGPDIHDFGCTLTAYRREALADVDLYGEEHRYIPAQLYDRGYRVTELPVTHHDRGSGSTHYGVGRLVRGLADLVFHVLWNRYSTRPFHLFGGVGLVALFVGTLIGGYYTLLKYVAGAALAPNLPQLLLSVGLVLFGILLVLFGIVIQFLTRIYYDGRPAYRVERVIDE